MKTHLVLRIGGVIACGLLFWTAVLGAQAQKSATKPAGHTGDLTGVWYPSSVNTFAFNWTDAQGHSLNALPLTPWGREKFKGNHPIGGQYTELTSNDPSYACLPPGIPHIYTHAYPVEFIQTPGRTIMF